MTADHIRKEVEKALLALGLSAGTIALEHPGDFSHGDYSTNVALALAKEAGKNPKTLAEEIAAQIPTSSMIARIQVAGPGFINFHLARDFFTEATSHALAEGEKWGSNQTLAGKKVMVEYTSPNLFKPLHIGNLMSNIMGESIARLFEANGAEVKRVNYPSDIGLTVAKGVWGLKKTGGDPKDIAALGEAYRVGNTGYEEDADAKKEIEEINRALYAGSDVELNALRGAGIATSKRHLDDICKTLGTEFDLEFFESEAAPVGKAIVESHIEDGIFEKSDGAVIFRGENHGLHTRVFINSMGLPTYEAKDVGLMSLKKDAYAFDLSVTTTAVEQRDYFKVLIRALELIFPELEGKVKHLAYGFLTLTTGKMSSRKGNVITGESLIEDMKSAAREKMEGRELADKESVAEMVAVAAIKYVILKQSTGRDIIFDPEKSLSFEGDSGPYLQYAHTRALSVLEKAAKEGVAAFDPAEAAPRPESVTELERLLYRFPEIVERASVEYEPHYITTYLTELSGAFSSWYANEKIVELSDPTSPYKVALTRAFQMTVERGLHLLGIRTPEKM